MFDSVGLLSAIRGFYRDLCLKYICGFGPNVGLALTRCREYNFSYISSAEISKQALSLYIYLTLNHGRQL